MTDIEALKILQKANIELSRRNGKTLLTMALIKVIPALQEKVERERPKPLTLEELKKEVKDNRNGWLWLESLTCDDFSGWESNKNLYLWGNLATYNKKWLAYRYKPNHFIDVGEKGNHNDEANEKVCKRYIDADLLCKKLKDTANRIISDSIKMGIVPTIQDEERTDTLLDVIDLIKRSANSDKMGWIPVSEGLPEVEVDQIPPDDGFDNGKLYLVCHKDGYIDTQSFWNKANKFDEDDVIAWRPMPEPYKPKE